MLNVLVQSMAPMRTALESAGKTAPPEAVTAAEAAQTQRFAQALRQAMVRNRLSERRLATELGITIGTTQKYFRFRVQPLKVATGINRQLARLLGITLDALVSFYETGEFRNALSFDEVASWLRSDAGIEHLAPVLEAMSDLSKKATSCGGAPELPPARYTWPLEELEQAKVSPALRQRMGLTEGALEALATEGVFTDELVEAFSIAVNLDEGAVREAFAARTAVL
jgi:transcriptional regulator with XRE-family HTH domain